MKNKSECYVEYAGFVGKPKDRLPMAEADFGVPPEKRSKPRKLSIVGRADSYTPTSDADIKLFIKPGTSKHDTLALVDMIRKAIVEFGGWEHDPQSENVVPLAEGN